MTQSDNKARYLWIAGIAGPIIFLGGWVVLSLLDPTHNFIAEAGSSLGFRFGAQFPEIWKLNTFMLGVGTIAFAGGLALRFRKEWRSLSGTFLWFFVGIGGVLAGIFKVGYTEPAFIGTIDPLVLFAGVIAILLMS